MQVHVEGGEFEAHGFVILPLARQLFPLNWSAPALSKPSSSGREPLQSMHGLLYVLPPSEVLGRRLLIHSARQPEYYQRSEFNPVHDHIKSPEHKVKPHSTACSVSPYGEGGLSY